MTMGTITDRVDAYVRDTVAGLAPGDQLPSERTIAGELGASRTTVRLVLSNAVAAGLIRAEHGRGYFVTRRRASRARHAG